MNINSKIQRSIKENIISFSDTAKSEDYINIEYRGPKSEIISEWKVKFQNDGLIQNRNPIITSEKHLKIDLQEATINSEKIIQRIKDETAINVQEILKEKGINIDLLNKVINDKITKVLNDKNILDTKLDMVINYHYDVNTNTLIIRSNFSYPGIADSIDNTLHYCGNILASKRIGYKQELQNWEEQLKSIFEVKLNKDIYSIIERISDVKTFDLFAYFQNYENLLFLGILSVPPLLILSSFIVLTILRKIRVNAIRINEEFSTGAPQFLIAFSTMIGLSLITLATSYLLHPDVIALFISIAENYDVFGIHLDKIILIVKSLDVLGKAKIMLGLGIIGLTTTVAWRKRWMEVFSEKKDFKNVKLMFETLYLNTVRILFGENFNSKNGIEK